MSETVFFCYSKADQESVLSLATALRNRGVPLWLDQWNIAAGADWDRSVDDALEASGKFLIALSPDALESREVRGELRVALDLKKHIVPVLLRECALPRQLRNTQYVDFTGADPTDETCLSALVVALSSHRRSNDEASPPRQQGSAKLSLSGQRPSQSAEALRREHAAVRPPHRIRLATGLLWGVFAIEFILWLTFPKWGVQERMGSFSHLLLAAVDLGLLACLILPIAQGRNWARFVYVPIFLLRFLALLELPTLAKVSPSELYFNVSVGLLFAQLLMGLFALYLLFFGSGASWFEQRGKAA